MAKDLLWLKERTKLILDANPLQADSDFTDDQIGGAINEAYEDEINRAKSEVSHLYFYQTNTFTWPASSATIETDSANWSWLQNADLFLFQDITAGTNRPFDLKLYWQSRKTLFWGDPQGPGSDRTIRVTYVGNAEELWADSDQPELIDPSHRQLLAWSAAILLREIADEQAPKAWIRRRDDLRFSWWKRLEARPREDVPRVSPHNETTGFNRGRNSYWSYLG